MSVEEIERYNVLADEIRKLGSELQTAEKSREIASVQAQQALYAFIADHLKALDERLAKLEEAAKRGGERNTNIKIAIEDFSAQLCRIENMLVNRRAQPKRKRERKGKK